jgi:hypothetical protein
MAISCAADNWPSSSADMSAVKKESIKNKLSLIVFIDIKGYDCN